MIPTLLPSHFGIASTHPEDWNDVASLSTLYPPSGSSSSSKSVYPAFGVHPWWVHRVDEPMEQYMSRLEALLSSTPASVCGEIGLDKLTAKREAAEGQDWTEIYAKQKKVFERQLQLAASLNKPVVCHCVNSYGDIYDTFTSGIALPPKIYMHAYGGSADFAKNLQRLRGTDVYFGFAAAINLKSKKTEDVLEGIPAERVLLESDLEQPQRLDECITEMLKVIARVKKITVGAAQELTFQNGQAFYNTMATPRGAAEPNM